MRAENRHAFIFSENAVIFIGPCISCKLRYIVLNHCIFGTFVIIFLKGDDVMANFQDFLSSILPGNYALTKSMEMTRINTSGTLWYMKKFLVLYYYIFLSDKIDTPEYIDEVIGHFDNYIGTLDESVKPSAEKFFYPQDSAVNFQLDSFKTFSLLYCMEILIRTLRKRHICQRRKSIILRF